MDDFNPNWRTPPGTTIQECIEHMGYSIAEFIKEMDITESQFINLMTGDLEINDELATKLERIFGSSQQFWLNRDANYRKPFPDIASILRKLNKFEIINACESVEELANAILMIAEDGVIKGRTQEFNANRMAQAVPRVIQGELPPNKLTREFGIRSQALYLKYYTNYENSNPK